MEHEMTLDEMYEGILKGKTYELETTLETEWELYKKNVHRYFVPGSSDVIYKHTDVMDEKDYIEYSHYGSSAKDLSKESLKWLLDVIFKKEPKDFVEVDVHSILHVINKGR